MDWHWIRSAIDDEIKAHKSSIQGLCSLAVGSDQVFAEAIIDAGHDLVAVIPQVDYEKHFPVEGRRRFRMFLESAEVIQLDEADDEEAFLRAGMYIVEHSDLMLAVWDGKEAAGKGGTADIVHFARSRRKHLVHIDPLRRVVFR